MSGQGDAVLAPEKGSGALLRKVGRGFLVWARLRNFRELSK